MDHLEISIEANNKDSPTRWQERCYPRLKSLQNKAEELNSNNQVVVLQNKEKEVMSRDLYEAARDGNVDAFVDVLEALCVKNQATLNDFFYDVTPAGDTVLHVAAEFGNEKITELICFYYPELLTWTNNKVDTPLHVAARAKTLQVMKVLNSLEQVNIIKRANNCYGNTPLHEAVLSKHFDGVSLLLNLDQTVAHDLNESKKSPLYLAVETGDVKILHLLLEIPFPPYDPWPKHHGNSPLHAAILYRNPVMLKEIVNMRPDVMDLRDEDGGSALHFAAQTGYVKGVRILLNKSVLNALKFNIEGDLPVQIACKMGHLDVVKELLHQEWPHPKILLDLKGGNILHIAAKNGKNNVVKYLLRNPKIDTSMVNERDKNGNTPLHLASKNLCLWTLLALLQDKRVDVKSMNNKGLTARDIVWLNSNIPKTRQQYLCGVILESAGVPLKSNMLRTVKLRVPNVDWNVKDAANTLILVGILIATVTFAAGFTIPGGVYGSDEADPRKRGMAVLAHETLFNIFMALNSVAMYSSTLGSVILIWVQLGDRRFAHGAYVLAMLFVYLALIAMPVAFMAAIRLVVSNNRLLADVVTVIGLMFIFFILLIRILGRFPLGIRLPLFRLVGEFFIRIILVLFYGRHDVLLNGKGKKGKEDLPKFDLPEVNFGLSHSGLF